MKSEYILNPTNFNYRVSDHFPQIKNKIGVFLSGGLESTLISLIAFEIYGKDNVLLFYSDDIFSNNNQTINRNIRTNLSRAAKLLDKEPVYIEFDYNWHITDRKASVEHNIERIRKEYNVDYTLWGFTKLFFEVEPFKQDGLTLENVVAMAMSDPVRFNHTIEEFHLETNEYSHYLLEIDIPAEVYPLLRGESDFILSPFKDLNKCEVIDFYRQLGWLEKASKTSSCILDSISENEKHCGHCFNCQQRYDAYRILGIPGVEDQTPYNSNAIVERRSKLEKVRNAAHT